MAKKMLFILLYIAFVFEMGLVLGSFFATSFTLKLFKVADTTDTSFLAFIVGCLCFFVAMITVFTIWRLRQKDHTAFILCYVLGFFWIAIGLAIYAGFKRPDNLLIDSLKGLLIVICTYLSQKRASQAMSLN